MAEHSGETRMTNEYMLSYRDEERDISHIFVVNDEDPHWEVHRQFITFLSAIYGYDLHGEYTQE
jgi:hypothetical protein